MPLNLLRFFPRLLHEQISLICFKTAPLQELRNRKQKVQQLEIKVNPGGTVDSEGN